MFHLRSQWYEPVSSIPTIVSYPCIKRTHSDRTCHAITFLGQDRSGLHRHCRGCHNIQTIFPAVLSLDDLGFSQHSVQVHFYSFIWSFKSNNNGTIERKPVP